MTTWTNTNHMEKNGHELGALLERLATFITTTKLDSTTLDSIITQVAEIQEAYKADQITISSSISSIYECIGNLRLTVQYLQFDLEATRRERDEARIECERLRQQLGDI